MSAEGIMRAPDEGSVQAQASAGPNDSVNADLSGKYCDFFCLFCVWLFMCSVVPTN